MIGRDTRSRVTRQVIEGDRCVLWDRHHCVRGDNSNLMMHILFSSELFSQSCTVCEFWRVVRGGNEVITEFWDIYGVRVQPRCFSRCSICVWEFEFRMTLFDQFYHLCLCLVSVRLQYTVQILSVILPQVSNLNVKGSRAGVTRVTNTRRVDSPCRFTRAAKRMSFSAGRRKHALYQRWKKGLCP